MEKPTISKEQEEAIEAILASEDFVLVTRNKDEDGAMVVNTPYFSSVITALGLLRYGTREIKNLIDTFSDSEDDE